MEPRPTQPAPIPVESASISAPQQRHGIEIAPLQSVASPHGIEFEDGQEQWWRPSWEEIWRHLGYRRLLFLPLVGLFGLMMATFFHLSLLKYVWWLGLKAGLIVIAIPFALGAYGIAGVTKKRRDPFCIHCGYSLEGLPDLHHCPECGRRYSFAQVEEYRRDPEWFIKRWRVRHHIPASHGQIMAGPNSTRKKSRDGT